MTNVVLYIFSFIYLRSILQDTHKFYKYYFSRCEQNFHCYVNDPLSSYIVFCSNLILFCIIILLKTFFWYMTDICSIPLIFNFPIASVF